MWSLWLEGRAGLLKEVRSWWLMQHQWQTFALKLGMSVLTAGLVLLVKVRI